MPQSQEQTKKEEQPEEQNQSQEQPNDNDQNQEEDPDNNVQEDYNNAFEDAFGKPSEDQTWGF